MSEYHASCVPELVCICDDELCNHGELWTVHCYWHKQEEWPCSTYVATHPENKVIRQKKYTERVERRARL